ncbi:MAG TPA: molybdopterin-binding protein, partial [Tissierellales bacterium]|nr:molybdopterin-binding protein [Tissierellales bacterium]
MKCEIVAVGTELLLGNTTNTNAQYLSKELSKIGVDVSYHTVVGDSPKDLENVINISLNRADIILFTGGLGPTQDDMTKEIVCESLGI